MEITKCQKFLISFLIIQSTTHQWSTNEQFTLTKLLYSKLFIDISSIYMPKINIMSHGHFSRPIIHCCVHFLDWHGLTLNVPCLSLMQKFWSSSPIIIMVTNIEQKDKNHSGPPTNMSFWPCCVKPPCFPRFPLCSKTKLCVDFWTSEFAYYLKAQ